jgi:branched-subunit amino acid aminotransferase/4-amino-4-deoxychorismate lyase
LNPPPNTAWLWTENGFTAAGSVPLTDRGFRYGMSVFESFPLRKGVPFFLRQHLDRLEKSAAQVGFKTALPSRDKVEKLLREVPFGGFARIYVTAGDGDVYRAAERCRIFVFVEPREPSALVACKLARHPQPHAPAFAGLKTANYWPNIAALQTAKSAGFDEALLFNADRKLISACMANVFVVRDGKINTPALDCGARRGVVREWVAQRRSVQECTLADDDLLHAEEIFLTNSWLGILPAASLDARSLPSRAVAAALRDEYETSIQWHFPSS